LELIEKDTLSDKIMAKTRATVWAFAFRMLKPYFESTTGETFRPGIKVMLMVMVEFHQVYGFSLNVQDIDPNYTLGDMARKRAEIIEQLQADGVMDMNKLLELPRVPQNIAIISSDTAAGYGDFLHQLMNNEFGYHFNTRLFAAVMQGHKTTDSIINALEAVFSDSTEYDVVVIIRGGGSKSDLSSSDSYDLAYYITQFPLPVITGIGHERDDSVVDMVAHTRLKTPTAVAEFLIEQLMSVDEYLDELIEQLAGFSTTYVQNRLEKVDELSYKLQHNTRNLLDDHRDYLTTAKQRLIGATHHLLNRRVSSIHYFGHRLKLALSSAISHQYYQLGNHQTRLVKWTNNYLDKKERRLSYFEARKNALKPENTLKRGFAIVSHNNQIIKEASQLNKGDIVKVKLYKGNIETEVKQVKE
jgi:exodeoxyribonuclease VII large subunit